MTGSKDQEKRQGKHKKLPEMSNIYGNRFCGAWMGQTWQALFVFEWIFNMYNFYWLVEFGTGRGGLSIFFGIQAMMRNLFFVSFDCKNRMWEEANFETPNNPYDFGKVVNFRKADIFNPRTMEYVADLVRGGPAFIYCDNGSKPKELDTYARVIFSDSVIGVHDWHPPHFEGIDEEELAIEPISDINAFCDRHKTRQRFWVKL